MRHLISGCFFFCAVVAAQGAAASECHDDVVHLRGDWGQARFNIEVADSNRERAQGLMHRPSMPQSAGMLFVYENPAPLSFWMRNTLIELDMLFIDSSGVVYKIHDRAQPLDETPIVGGRGLAVLEINGGLAEAMGITEGTQIRHPKFDKGDVAWPC